MEKPPLGFLVLCVFRLVLLLSMLVFSALSQDANVMGILKNAIAINASNNLQWSDPDVCKWNHVQCNSVLRVAAIRIGRLNLQGSLPKELVQLTELERFECEQNNLAGQFPYMPKSLQRLIIHDNNFSSIPDDFFKGMTNLQEVRIDDNPFYQRPIPDSLKDCVALQTFSAMNAGFIGKIPDIFGIHGPIPALVFLGLGFNFLEGDLPASLAGSSIQNFLVNAQKSDSKLNGTLAVLQNMTSLKQIWVHGNSFTGPIPDLSNHDQLFHVSIRDNLLTGVVPPSLISLPSLQVVNLTNNFLQGSPPKFNIGVSVDNNIEGYNNRFCTKVVGQSCSPLVNALLSVVEPLGYPLKLAESWEGNDPCSNGWIGIVCDGGKISVINFQNMALAGTISPSFATLTSMTKLLLADNSLTGTIPSELTSMLHLQELDVSNNHLYGQTPSFREGVIFKYSGNPDIGKLNPPSSPGSDSGGGGEGKKHNNAAIIGIVVAVVIVLVLGILLVFIKFDRKHKNPGADVDGRGTGAFSLTSNVQTVEAGNMVISIQVLRQVTNNFSEENILGKGGFGTVYKGELHDGTKIAVKRMEPGAMGEKGLSEFKAEIAVLTKVRHRHLVALLGHCLEGNERLLVYEYMPQGPLSSHLFHWKRKGLKPLEWKTRLTIALDVARGVEYLHGLTQQIFIHRDLKPSNILLGDDMRAKVSDFGLVRLAPEGKDSFETRVAGTFGYLAPEYAATGRVATKVDVYSFGVILMQMITGRKAVDHNTQSEENFHLVTWFHRVLINKDSFQKFIDPIIDVDDAETLASMSTVAELAGHCCAYEPYQRPDMGHVVHVLAPLVEMWKPAEPNADDINIYGIDFDMRLSSSSSVLTSGENTQSIILTRHPDLHIPLHLPMDDEV